MASKVIVQNYENHNTTGLIQIIAMWILQIIWASPRTMLDYKPKSYITLAPSSRSYQNHSLWHKRIVGLHSSLRRRQMSPFCFSSSFAKREMAQNVVPLTCVDQWHLAFLIGTTDRELWDMELRRMPKFGDDHSAMVRHMREATSLKSLTRREWSRSQLAINEVSASLQSSKMWPTRNRLTSSCR